MLLVALALDRDHERFCCLDADFSASYELLRRERVTDEVLELYLLFQGASLWCRQIRPVQRAVLALGDQMAAAWAGAMVRLGGELVPTAVHPISGMSILKINRDGALAAAFWDSVASAAHYEALILVLGTHDCETCIPKRMGEFKTDRLDTAIETVVGAYQSVLERMKLRAPATRLYVYPALPRFRWTAPIVHEFNKVMRATIPPLAMVMAAYEVMSGVETISVTAHGLPSREAYEDFQNHYPD